MPGSSRCRRRSDDLQEEAGDVRLGAVRRTQRARADARAARGQGCRGHARSHRQALFDVATAYAEYVRAKMTYRSRRLQRRLDPLRARDGRERSSFRARRRPRRVPDAQGEAGDRGGTRSRPRRWETTALGSDAKTGSPYATTETTWRTYRDAEIDLYVHGRSHRAATGASRDDGDALRAPHRGAVRPERRPPSAARRRVPGRKLPAARSSSPHSSRANAKTRPACTCAERGSWVRQSRELVCHCEHRAEHRARLVQLLDEHPIRPGRAFA